MKLESEKVGQAAVERHKRNMRAGFIASTWKKWYCWSQWLPDDPEWSTGGMIWNYPGEKGQVLFGGN
jgi:hypothetical protein